MPLVDFIPILVVACAIAIPVFYIIAEFVNTRKV